MCTTINVVTDFGADPSGVNDSSIAFQDAFDAAMGYGGGTVVIPAGTYDLSDWTSYTNSERLIINGEGATINGPSGQTFLAPRAHAELRGLRFNGFDSVVATTARLCVSGTLSPDAAGDYVRDDFYNGRRSWTLEGNWHIWYDAGDEFYYLSSQRGEKTTAWRSESLLGEYTPYAGVTGTPLVAPPDSVSRLVFETNEASGIKTPVEMETPVDNVLISENSFRAGGAKAIRIGLDEQALQETWRNVTVTQNYVSGITSTGGTSACAVLVYGKRAVVSNNTIENVSSVDGECWGVYTKARHSVISGNTLNGFASSGGAIAVIHIKGSGRGDVTKPQGYATLVTGNVVVIGGGVGEGIRSANDDVKISDNIVEDCSIGIGSQSGGQDNNNITNNIVRDFADYGINLALNGDNLVCSGNGVTGAGTAGIRCASGAHTRGVVISDNAIKKSGSGIGIFVKNYANCTIADLSVANNVIDGCQTAIYEENSDTQEYICNMAVADNVISNCTDGVVLKRVDGVQLHDNRFSNLSGEALKISLATNVVAHNNVVGGTGNVCIGDQAGWSSIGDDNTLVGRAAGASLTTGSSNVFVGCQAGSNVTTDSNRLYIANNQSDTLIYGEFDNGVLSVGLGHLAQRDLDANLERHDIVVRRDVDGGCSYSEAGALLRLERDVTNVTGEDGRFLEWGTTGVLGWIDAQGKLRAAGYKSSDDSEGITQTINIVADGTHTLTFKNGILTAYTTS